MIQLKERSENKTEIRGNVNWRKVELRHKVLERMWQHRRGDRLAWTVMTRIEIEVSGEIKIRNRFACRGRKFVLRCACSVRCLTRSRLVGGRKTSAQAFVCKSSQSFPFAYQLLPLIVDDLVSLSSYLVLLICKCTHIMWLTDSLINLSPPRSFQSRSRRAISLIKIFSCRLADSCSVGYDKLSSITWGCFDVERVSIGRSMENH